MEKIKIELENTKNNKGFAQVIASYITKRCKVDDYRKRVELEEKNLNECLSYIMSEVEKIAQGSKMVAATDDEVFKFVDDYYFKTKEELDIKPAPQATVEYAKVDPPAKVEKPKEEKKSILSKKEVVKNKVDDNQVTLFDLLG